MYVPSQLDDLGDKGVEGTETLEAEEGTREATSTPIPSTADMQDVCGYYYNLMDGTMSAAEVCQADIVSSTTTLWLQYIEMVDILRMFI